MPDEHVRHEASSCNCPKCDKPLIIGIDARTNKAFSLKCTWCGYYQRLDVKPKAGPGLVPANYAQEHRN